MKRLAEMYLPFITIIFSIIFCLYCYLNTFTLSENTQENLLQYLVTMSSIFLSFDGVMLGLLYPLIDKVRSNNLSVNMYQDIYKYTCQSIFINFFSILLVVIYSFFPKQYEFLFMYIIIISTTAVISFNFRVIYILLAMVKININTPCYRN